MPPNSDQAAATAILASRYLPAYQFSERHEIAPINAAVDVILDAVKNYDDRQDRVLNYLLRVRELPGRTLARLGLGSALRDRPRFGLADFLLLEETGNEVAFGLAGRFWKLDYGLTRLTNAAEFLDYQKPGAAKLVMSFSVLPHVDGKWRLQTETRIWCPDQSSKLL